MENAANISIQLLLREITRHQTTIDIVCFGWRARLPKIPKDKINNRYCIPRWKGLSPDTAYSPHPLEHQYDSWVINLLFRQASLTTIKMAVGLALDCPEFGVSVSGQIHWVLSFNCRCNQFYPPEQPSPRTQRSPEQLRPQRLWYDDIAPNSFRVGSLGGRLSWRL